MSKLFDELFALKKAYDTKLEEEGEAAVKEVFKEFFEAHSNVESVYWTQYTPYFNDGDPCYFSVHDFHLELAEAETEDEDDEDEDEDNTDYEMSAWYLSRKEDPELKKLGEDLGTLSDIPDDVLESVFGDHCKVIATRDGFNVKEYSHD